MHQIIIALSVLLMAVTVQAEGVTSPQETSKVVKKIVAKTVKVTPGKVTVVDKKVVTKKVATKKVAASQPVEPKNAKEALATAKEAYNAMKAGHWWYFSGLVLMLIMFILKFAGLRFGFWVKLGRWRYIISPVLAIAAGLLATFQGGVSIEAAFAVFSSAYATSSLQELYEHGILGKPRASAE